MKDTITGLLVLAAALTVEANVLAAAAMIITAACIQAAGKRGRA